MLGLFVSEKCHDHIGGHHQNRGVAIYDRAVRLHSCESVELFSYVGGWRGVESEKRQNLASMIAKLQQAIHKTVVT